VAKADKSDDAKDVTDRETEDAVTEQEMSPDDTEETPVDEPPAEDVPEMSADEAQDSEHSDTVADEQGENGDDAEPFVQEDADPVEVVEETADASPAEQEDIPPSPAPVSQPKPASGGMFGLVIGGVLAGAIGFAAAEMNVLGARQDTSDLRETLVTQQAQIEALQSVEIPDFPEMPDVDALVSDISSLSDALSQIDARLAALEARPVAEGQTVDTAAYEATLQTLQASVETQRAEIETLLQNARSVEEATAAAAQNAKAQAALTQITVALNDGSSFAESLDELVANGFADVPEALSGAASTGVATLNALQADFAENARAALSTARSVGAQDGGEGMASFLRRQLGARSVTPREGSDPDAVLSRAEAAVREGRVAAALSELETLPQEAQDAMTDWLGSARARVGAEAAIQELSDRLTTN
jgi:hypothetical protein